MPILFKGNKTRADVLQDMKYLEKKRAERDAKKTKYFINRKDKSPEEYERIKIMVDGKELELSDSSKFFLEQLIKDSDVE